MLSLELLNTETQFSQVHAEWTELLAHSSSDCVFLTWEWLHTWWKHLAGARRLHILLVRHGSQLVAIAPLPSRSPALAKLSGVLALEFLGTGSVGSDSLDIFARHGHEDESIRALADYLQRGHFVVELRQLPEHGSLAKRLAAILQDQRWNASEIRTHLCPFIDLAGHTWKSFQATLGGSHRYNFNRRLKNLNRDFEVKFDCAA